MSPDLGNNRDDLVADKIIETVHFSKVLPEVYVYRDLLEALRNYAGYRDGDWENPGSNGDADTFYVFAYDWRRDNVENARELVRRIEHLKGKLNRPDLQFTILSHSMGGLIGRYAAMYGSADLPAGDGPIVPTWAGAVHINKIVMIGAPNEGSADAFATLLEGYSITEGLRRRVPLLNKLTAEDAITAPALYQLLPHGAAARILDENLEPLPINYYDPEIWKQYDWSLINNADFRRRYAQKGENALSMLDLYFKTVLHRAKRFHQALDAPSDIKPPVMLFAIGGDCEETLAAPVVLRDAKKDRWVTLIRPREYMTSAGKKMKKSLVTEAMYAPGDGRVTRSSLLGEHLASLNLGEKGTTLAGGGDGSSQNGTSQRGISLSLTHAVFGCDLHGQLQRNMTLQDNALSAIVGEIVR